MQLRRLQPLNLPRRMSAAVVYICLFRFEDGVILFFSQQCTAAELIQNDHTWPAQTALLDLEHSDT